MARYEYKRRKPAPRIKAAPKRQRKRKVHVRGYCRRKAKTLQERFAAKKDMPF
jgi:hypothetical protein